MLQFFSRTPFGKDDVIFKKIGIIVLNKGSELQNRNTCSDRIVIIEIIAYEYR